MRVLWEHGLTTESVLPGVLHQGFVLGWMLSQQGHLCKIINHVRVFFVTIDGGLGPMAPASWRPCTSEGNPVC